MHFVKIRPISVEMSIKGMDPFSSTKKKKKDEFQFAPNFFSDWLM